MNNENLLNEFSAKIKKLYIQIHDYSFFHGPSDAEQPDKNFIGRKKIINRLKTILSNSETKSGAYLITGYRGMGKSSVVGKVIQTMTDTRDTFYLISTILKLFLFLFLTISLLHIANTRFLSFILLPMFFAAAFLLYYLKRNHPSFNKTNFTRENNSNRGGKYFMKIVAETFNVFDKFRNEQKYTFFLYNIYLYLSTVLLYLILMRIFYSAEVKFYFLLSLLVFIPHLLASVWFRYKSRLSNKCKGLGSKLSIECWRKNTKEFFRLFAENYFNHSKKIYIKINLGHDDLHELDIFRLVARSVKTEYEKHKFRIRKGLFPRLIPFAIVAVTVWAAMQHPAVQSMSFKIKESVSLEVFFPSQLYYSESKRKFDRAFLKNTYVTSSTIKEPADFLDFLKTNHFGWYDKNVKAKLNQSLLNLSFYADRVILAVYLQLSPEAMPVYNLIFLLYFIALSFLMWLISKIKYFNISNRNINRKLRHLNDIINFQQTLEKGASIKPEGLFSSFNISHRKTRPIADAKEIERNLLEILEDISKAPFWNYRAEFVFIFDELDKIEPQSNLPDSDDKANMSDQYIVRQNILYTPEVSRKRLNQIYKLLANLKYFLSEAKSKFIFIAGRELYDAALADISDRDYFIRSIFHEVLYVPSFLSDDTDEKSSDINSMTEWYVLQFLLPVHFKNKILETQVSFTLSDYNRYLISEFKDEFNENHPLNKNSHVKRLVARQKREKVLTFLQQFISYLTHVSNGAPNRLKSTFEQYILQPDDDIKNKDCLIVGNPEKKGMFLSFDYFKQYQIGMFNYLINPITLSFSNTVRDYGDKILISASFLLDRLFKYHNHGFSWRFIELTPEIVDINKTPQLRDFVSKIINHLSDTHIQEIVNGLFTFKFPRRISQELSFISRISEEASAAFNFTLDETLGLKQIYFKQLEGLRQRYNKYEDERKSKFVHTISAVHAILGDLHFLSDEYNDAIIEYKESVQYLRNMLNDNMTPEHMILYIRNMLKLGLVFEKRRTFDPAFSTYGQITAKLLEKRTINVEKHGLGVAVRADKTDLHGFPEYVVYHNKETGGNVKRSDYFIPPVINNNISLSDISNSDPQIFDGDSLIDKVADYMDSNKAKETFKISVIEGIRLVYQPILAKLQIIEKNNIGGISYSDVRRTISEFKYLTRTAKISEKYLIESDFWKKVAHILYYKNGTVCKPDVSPKTNQQNDDKKHCSDTCFFDNESNLPFMACCRKTNLKKNDNNKWNACSACRFYFDGLGIFISKFVHSTKQKSLEELRNKTLKYQEGMTLRELLVAIGKIPKDLDYKYKRERKLNANMKVSKQTAEEVLGLFGYSCHRKYSVRLIEMLDSKDYLTKRPDNFATLAGLCSDIGNVFFSCSGENDKAHCIISIEFLKTFLDFVETDKTEAIISVLENEESKLQEAVIFYWLAAKFHKHANEFKNYSFSISKIIHLLNDIVTFSGQEANTKTVSESLERIKDVLILRAIRGIYTAYDSIHMTELNKAKDTFHAKENDANDYIQKPVSLSKLSLNTDIEEINISFAQLELEIAADSIKRKAKISTESLKPIKKHFLRNTVSPYILNDNMYNRILQLQYKTKLNASLLLSYGLPENYNIFSIFRTVKHLLDIIIYDLYSENQEENKRFFESIVKQSEITKIRKLNEFFQNHIFSKKIANLRDGLEFLITDSIFCHMNIIRHFNVFGISYGLNHSTIADTRYNLMKWGDLYDSYMLSYQLINEMRNGKYKQMSTLEDRAKTLLNSHIDLKDNTEIQDDFITCKWDDLDAEFKDLKKAIESKLNLIHKYCEAMNKKHPKKNKTMRQRIISTELKKNIEKSIGQEYLSYIMPAYQNGKAKKDYYAAIETHRQGKAYKEMIQNMYYLDDDFNDKYYHFSAARERYRINTGYIKRHINILKRKQRSSTLFDHDKYMETMIDKTEYSNQ